MGSAHKHKKPHLEKSDKKILFWIVVISIFIYIFTIAGTIGNFNQTYLVNSDFPGGSHQKSSYIQMLSIVNDGDVTLDRYQANRAIPDVAYYDGNFYSFFPPGRAVTSIPFYLAGSVINLGQFFVFMSVGLFSIATSILLYLIMHQVFRSKRETSVFVVFLYSIISLSLVFSLTFLQHAYASFFFALIFYLIWRFSQSNKNLLFQASFIWFLYGLSWFYDYSNIFIIGPLMLYFYITCVKDTGKFDKVGTKLQLFFRTIPIIILMITLHFGYNYLAHGDMLRLSNTLPQYYGSNYSHLVENSEAIAQQKTVARAFSAERVPYGLYTLFVDSTRSIFMYSPIFILILLVPVLRQRKNKLEQNILWISILAIVFMYASFPSPDGGWSFGPRYLVPALLCMSILIGLWLERLKDSMTIRISVVLLSLFTLAQTLSGLLGSAQVRTGEQTFWYGIKNFKYIREGTSRNFMYNEIIGDWITLQHYYIVILASISLLFLYIFYKKDWDSKK